MATPQSRTTPRRFLPLGESKGSNGAHPDAKVLKGIVFDVDGTLW